MKANDDAGAAKVIEKLVTYYPKPEYWANALAPLVRMDIKDCAPAAQCLPPDELTSACSSDRADYADMAEICARSGLSRARRSRCCRQAFAKNVFIEQRDKDRYQHLLDGAKQRAANDQASLPTVEEQDAAAPRTAISWCRSVRPIMSYGQNDKAVAAITKGIAKGGLEVARTRPTCCSASRSCARRNNAEAQKAFDKVCHARATAGYARLGKLWALPQAHSA